MYTHFVKLRRPKPSKVYNSYWHFAAKRQDVFTRRLTDPFGPWTNDPVIQEHRFTNVFRGSDRVSQSLIKLQYSCQGIEELFFKSLLFKVFNKIETYSYLERELGFISYDSFSFAKYDQLLTHRLAAKQRIYSAAYIMPSAGGVFGHKYKHSNHLALIDKMMKDRLYATISECKSLEESFRLLLAYPSLGSFLAFQYAIDLNYSTLTNFSEMDFVVAGPGAKNGILKCFESLGDYSFEDIIRFMADQQEQECEQLHIATPTLWGRRLQLIDCQNLFCEVDKYLRVTHPEVGGSTGRKRIKQKFSAPKGPIDYFFPPKWNINDQINNTCQPRVNADIFS